MFIWTKYHIELAIFYGANLQEADLQWANLQRADLWRANLQRADLWRANLQGANLQGANLQWADLQWANLQEADLQWANLRGANLRGQSRVPEIGSFIGFKKLRDGIIATVEICKTAKRCGGLIGPKCRASMVKVIALSTGKSAFGLYNPKVEYRLGKIVKADSWDDNIGVEYTHGIHFFLSRKEAEEFTL